MKKFKILGLLVFLNYLGLQAQPHIYAGLGIGRLKYFQGPAQTKAFLFNNNTNVSQEMQPNQNFNSYVIGCQSNFNRMSIGLEFNSKKNVYGGTLSNGISDEVTQRMNSYLLVVGVGNKVDKSKSKKIIWRIQGAAGVAKYKLLEKLQGTTNDFDGELGKQTVTLFQGSIGVWIPIIKHININVSPYIEALATDGYVDILQERINSTEYFNATNYGVNFNLAYGF
jgi:hypothetical protein